MAVCLGGVSAQGRGVYTSPPVDKILDTRLWKHCLSVTSFAGGKDAKALFTRNVFKPVFVSSTFNLFYIFTSCVNITIGIHLTHFKTVLSYTQPKTLRKDIEPILKSLLCVIMWHHNIFETECHLSNILYNIDTFSNASFKIKQKNHWIVFHGKIDIQNGCHFFLLD